MDSSQIPSADVKERYHQLALDIVKISAGVRDATREILLAQKANTFDETVLRVLKSNVDTLLTRNSTQLELLEQMSQLKKDPVNVDSLSGKDYDEALNDAVKEIESTSKSTERVAKLLESRLATLKSMKEAGIAPPLERPLTPPSKLGEGKPLMTGGAEAVGYDDVGAPIRYNNVSCAHVSVAFLATYYPFLGPLAASIPKTVQQQPDIFRRVKRACRDSNIDTVETKGDDPYYPDILGNPGVGMRVVDENCRVKGWGGLVFQEAPKPDELSHLLAVVREPLNIKGSTKRDDSEIIDLQGNIVYLWTHADDDGSERAADVNDLKYERQSKSMVEFPKRDDSFLYRLIKPTTILWIKSPIPLQDLEERRKEIQEVKDAWNPKAKRRKPKLSQAAAGGPDEEDDDDTEWEPPDDPFEAPPPRPEPKPIAESDQIRLLIEAQNEVERRQREEEERRRRFMGIGRGKRSFSASGLMHGGAEAVGYEGLRTPFTYNEYSCVHASISFLSVYYPFLRPMLDTIPNTATPFANKLKEIQRICDGLGIKTIAMDGYDPAEPDRLGNPGIPYEIVHEYCRLNGWGGLMIQAPRKKDDGIGHALPIVRENLPMAAGTRLAQGLPVYLLTQSYPDHREKEASLKDLAYENEALPFGQKKFNKLGPAFILWICKEIPISFTVEGRRDEIKRELDTSGEWHPVEGKRAVLTGLVVRPEYNGKEVLILKLDGDRWLVKMDGATESMRIKPENLTDVGLSL